MNLVNVAAVALNQTPLDWVRNTTNICNAINDARKQGAKIICFPELSITGYGCEDAFLSYDVQQSALREMQKIIPHTTGMVVTVGLPLMHAGALYNCVAVIADEELIGFVAKSNLAGDGIHYEPRWFKPWINGQISDYHFDGCTIPIGSQVFDFSGVRIGFEICEDAWAANRPGRDLSRKAVDIILNPSASHFAFDKQSIRRRLVLESSRAFGTTYVYANLLGNEAGRIIYDGSTLIASAGQMITEGLRLSFADFEIITACIDIDRVRMRRSSLASFQPNIEEFNRGCLKVDFDLTSPVAQLTQSNLATWEQLAESKEEEFSRAIALGLFDYLRKSQANGFVVSLSGGADSSAVAVLVWLIVQLGTKQLGHKRFIAKLTHIKDLEEAESIEQITNTILTTVYQATRNSSETTENAALKLAHAINARHISINIDPMVNSYIDSVSQQIGKKLTWVDDDITLQNIQARSRGPSAWLLANYYNAILLSTSNRSEAAVGYATMDGDTCGGLSPIAGIDKDFLVHWLKWMHKKGPEGIENLAELHSVVQQVPTAELRPQEAFQTDEDDLMPYKLLDWIERAAIRDKQGPVNIIKMMRIEFPEIEVSQLANWIERFFRLWSRNQWKRERYAPSFHLDDENLDPKTWCRFPILSGGFNTEIEEMRHFIDREYQLTTI